MKRAVAALILLLGFAAGAAAQPGIAAVVSYVKGAVFVSPAGGGKETPVIKRLGLSPGSTLVDRDPANPALVRFMTATGEQSVSRFPFTLSTRSLDPSAINGMQFLVGGGIVKPRSRGPLPTTPDPFLWSTSLGRVPESLLSAGLRVRLDPRLSSMDTRTIDPLSFTFAPGLEVDSARYLVKRRDGSIVFEGSCAPVREGPGAWAFELGAAALEPGGEYVLGILVTAKTGQVLPADFSFAVVAEKDYETVAAKAVDSAAAIQEDYARALAVVGALNRELYTIPALRQLFESKALEAIAEGK